MNVRFSMFVAVFVFLRLSKKKQVVLEGQKMSLIILHGFSILRMLSKLHWSYGKNFFAQKICC